MNFGNGRQGKDHTKHPTILVSDQFNHKSAKRAQKKRRKTKGNSVKLEQPKTNISHINIILNAYVLHHGRLLSVIRRVSERRSEVLV